MSGISKYIKIVRRNWKKSLFASGLFVYGITSAKSKYEINVFMKARCKEAEKYGNESMPVTSDLRSITVILNPAANKKKAKNDYEKYCEPLFHMAGLIVNLIQTSSVGHAREIIDGIPKNEPVVIAGGDGTLSEALTGILRQADSSEKRVIGILPLGRVNNFGNQLFPLENSLPKVKQLTHAAMTVIKNHHESRDVMKVEVIPDSDDRVAKPIYALSALEWGAFRDAFAKRDKYWFYGGLRDYVTYIFNGYKSSLCWDCKGTLKYSPPCNGCNNCQTVVMKKEQSFRMFDLIIPKTKNTDKQKDFSTISNPECSLVHQKPFKSVNLKVTLNNSCSSRPAYLSLNLDKPEMGYFEFISQGWKNVNNKVQAVEECFQARSIELNPETVPKEDSEIFYEIDNEEYDVKPVKISVIPRAINIYC